MRPLREENTGRRRYSVRHVTRYDYSEDVTASYGRAFLRARDTVAQRVLGNDIEITPEPDVFTQHVDLFGNFSHYFEIHTPHRELTVAKTTIVEVDAAAPDLAALDAWSVGEAARVALATPAGSVSASAIGSVGGAVGGADDPTLLAGYLLPSTLVEIGPSVREYAREVLAEDAPLGAALAELVTRIHADFAYRKGATTVTTTLPELLTIRAGVCQDFAHLALGCLRAVGLPARYVSGYLETQPPPGKPKLQGSDATHAWVSVRLPGGAWLDLDPTNDTVADARYVTNAWGRDYRDVAPLKGVIVTEGATTSLDVGVDVTRL